MRARAAIISILLFLAQCASGRPARAAEATSWKPLFNGRNLDGWAHVGKGAMRVEQGLLRTEGGMGLLYWKERIGDAVIRVVYRMRDHNDNSGVFIRIPVEPREEWMPVHYGYEVQIDNDPESSGENAHHVTGSLYSLTRALARPGKPGPQWNTMEITLRGPHIGVSVNGVLVTDYAEGAPVPPRRAEYEPARGPRPLDGYIGLQNHSEKDVVFFREVSLRALPAGGG